MDLRIVRGRRRPYKLWMQPPSANSATENQTIPGAGNASWQRSLLEGAGRPWKTTRAAADWGAFIGRGKGLPGAGVAADMEQSGLLIRDPYSGAAKGECALTLSYFWQLGSPSPSNFARLKFVT